MRHLFILNPAAGQGAALKLEKKIWQAADKCGIVPEIYVTKSPGDGEEYARFKCETVCRTEGDRLRIYACGGDGTLNEVVNGIVGFDGVEVANIPAGTGNDFIRNFDGDFENIEAQMKGESHICDLIKYSGLAGGRPIEGYVANMFNIGFDCNVVDLTETMKKKPLLKGPLAYLASVGVLLAKKEGARLKVSCDDGYVYEGKLLLIAIANGCYCGGGVKGIPLARADDGLIDVSLVKNTTRRTFVRLFPKYSKGTHLDTKKAREIVDYRKVKSLEIEPSGSDEMKICIDGEIAMVESMKFEIEPGAFKFVVPGR